MVGSGGLGGFGQTVGRDGLVVLTVGGLNAIAPLLAPAQAGGLHESGDAIAAMGGALLVERLLDARTAVSLPAAGKNGGDLAGELLIRHRPRTGAITAVLPAVETAGGPV